MTESKVVTEYQRLIGSVRGFANVIDRWRNEYGEGATDSLQKLFYIQSLDGEWKEVLLDNEVTKIIDQWVMTARTMAPDQIDEMTQPAYYEEYARLIRDHFDKIVEVNLIKNGCDLLFDLFRTQEMNRYDRIASRMSTLGTLFDQWNDTAFSLVRKNRFGEKND